MIEGGSEVEQVGQRQVIRLTGITITGPDGKDNVAGTKRREIYYCNGRGDMAHYALVLKGVNVITIGRIYNPDSHIRAHRMASTIDIIVSRSKDGVWCADLYVDTGVDYETLLEMYNIDTLKMILGDFGMNVELLPVYELSSPGEVFVIEPSRDTTRESKVFLPTYNGASHRISGTEKLAKGRYRCIGGGYYTYGDTKMWGFIFYDYREGDSIVVCRRQFHFIPVGSQILENLTEVTN